MSMGRANIFPLHLFAMRLGKRDRPFDTSFHRHALHCKHRIIDGVKGFKKLSEIVAWHLVSLLRPEPDKHVDQHVASQLKDILNKLPIRLQHAHCG
jgi:hypothetical protein